MGSWDTGKIVLFYESNIFVITYGYNLADNTYLERMNCDYVIPLEDKYFATKRIGDAIYFYIKKITPYTTNSRVIIITLFYENYAPTYYIKNTSLKDSDMDKIF